MILLPFFDADAYSTLPLTNQNTVSFLVATLCYLTIDANKEWILVRVTMLSSFHFIISAWSECMWKRVYVDPWVESACKKRDTDEGTHDTYDCFAPLFLFFFPALFASIVILVSPLPLSAFPFSLNRSSQTAIDAVLCRRLRMLLCVRK